MDKPDHQLHLLSKSFVCPHCHTLTSQTWYTAYFVEVVGALHDSNYWNAPWIDQDEPGIGLKSCGGSLENVRQPVHQASNLALSRCYVCNCVAVWIDFGLVHPEASSIAPPNPDLPDDIRRDYLEASAIWRASPRGAAALLRLALQKLCERAGSESRTLDNQIKELEKLGLPKRIVEAMHAVRFVGNKALHPGEIAVGEDPQVVASLFNLVNLVCDNLISQDIKVSKILDIADTEGKHKGDIGGKR